MNTYLNKLLQIWIPVFAMVTVGLTNLSAAPPTAGADNPERMAGQKRPFSVYDSNQDGVLSRGEYQQFRARIKPRKPRGAKRALSFDEIDQNRDDYITEDELVSSLNSRLKEHRHKRYRGGRQ